MIRTLRITSIIAAITALVLLVLPIVYGVREDPEIEQLLKSPTAVESFKKAAGNKQTKGQDQLSPLVRQADAFARYLSPKPKPAKPAAGKRITDRPKTRPMGNVSAKFELVATSFYKSHPELSLALIDEPGKDLRWVRQGGKVGHLVIEQVGDGSITTRDGQRTSEIKVKRDHIRETLVKDEHSTPNAKVPTRPGIRHSPTTPKVPVSARKTPSPRARSRISRRTLLTEPVSAPAKISEQERTRLDELIARLQAMPDEDANDSAAAVKRAEMMEKLISDIGSTDLSPEEQELLGHLGERLNPVDDVPPKPADADEHDADNADEPQPPPPPPDK